MTLVSSPTKKDPALDRFGPRGLLSVRRVNVILSAVLTPVLLALLVVNADQIGRRIEFWRTGKVRIDGLTYYLNPADAYLTQLVLSDGRYEPEETRLFRSNCRPGDTVVDVGANVGWYTVIASKLVGSKGRVIAFEPDPDNFAILKRNVAANGCDNVTLEQKALSNAPGSLTLHLDRANKGMHSTVFDWKGGDIEVEAVRLDDYLGAGSGKVDFVKIDVEGAEPMVLEGMARTIASCPGIRLVVEFAPNRVLGAGRRPREYLDGFTERGFHIQVIDEAKGRVVPTTPADLLARFAGGLQGDYTNLFLRRGPG